MLCVFKEKVKTKKSSLLFIVYWPFYHSMLHYYTVKAADLSIVIIAIKIVLSAARAVARVR